MTRLVTLLRREGALIWAQARNFSPVFCSVAALVGYVLNYFGLPVFGGTELVFGSVAGVLVAVAFGPFAGGTVAAVAMSATWARWGHPYGVVIFAMESWFIGWFIHRFRWSLLKSALVFWVAIGGPLTTWMVVFSWQPAFPADWAITLKYPANAVVVIFLVQVLVHYRTTWDLLRLPAPVALTDESVNDRLLRGVVMAFAFPTLAGGVLAGAILNLQLQSGNARNLESAAYSLSANVLDYVAQHQRVIESIATGMESSRRSDDSLVTLLNDIRRRNPGFITMLIADESGSVTTTSPAFSGVGSVADRSYFREAKFDGPAYVSPVFRGRGFGDDMIVAISAAFMRDGRRHVIEGSLNIKVLLDYVKASPFVQQREVLLFDNRNSLILHRRLPSNTSASPEKFQLPIDHEPGKSISDTTVRRADGHTEIYYGAWASVPDYDWEIYLREPAWNSVYPIARVYLIGSLALLALLVSGYFLASNLLRRLTLPFTQLANSTAALISGEEPPPAVEKDQEALPREWRALAKGMRLAAQKIATANRELKTALADRDLAMSELRELAASLEARVWQRTAELEAARTAAERASQAKTEFLSIVSHELRTPLNVALGHVHLLLHHPRNKLPDDVATRVRKIKVSADHLLTLINDILDFAKLEAGKTELEFGLVDVAQLLSECADFFREDFAARQLRFSVETPPAPLMLCADMRRLRQALINLLSNAGKFTSPGGEIGLRAEADPEHGTVSFIVSDTGIGMDENQLKKIFVPFEQADRSFSRKYGGTGLGLPIVQHLVHLHQGTIRVSSALGQGSRFTITIPSNPPPNSSANSTPSAS